MPEPLCLVHGRTYRDRQGVVVQVTKYSWDWGFKGRSVRNGCFMGYYENDGRTIGGEPSLSDLVAEVTEEPDANP